MCMHTCAGGHAKQNNLRILTYTHLRTCTHTHMHAYILTYTRMHENLDKCILHTYIPTCIHTPNPNRRSRRARSRHYAVVSRSHTVAQAQGHVRARRSRRQGTCALHRPHKCKVLRARTKHEHGCSGDKQQQKQQQRDLV
jgi:hypothetical protein